MSTFISPIDSLVPNPCLIAIILTISTHNGPQFILHYPPEPDNHDYQAASFRNPWRDFSSSSSSHSSISSSGASSGESNSSDSDGVASDENSDYEVPNNYNNIKGSDHKDSSRQHSSTVSTGEKNNGYFGAFFKVKSVAYSTNGSKSHAVTQSQTAKLTRSERNPLNPFLKRVTDEAEKIMAREEESLHFSAGRPFVRDGFDFDEIDELGAFDPAPAKISEKKRKSRLSPSKKTLDNSKKSYIRASINNDTDKPSAVSSTINNQGNTDRMKTTANTTSEFLEGPECSPSAEKPPTGAEGNPSNGSSSESVLGFDTTFLSELLVPPRDLCNTLFELAVDDMVFVGMPVHVRHDGQWLRRKMNRRSTPAKQNLFPTTSMNNDSYDTDGGREDVDEGTEADDEKEYSAGHYEKLFQFEFSAPSNNACDTLYVSDDERHFHDETAHNPKSKRTAPSLQDASGHEFTDPKSDMRMFHVSFVVNPPVREFPERLAQMYQCIAARFARMLRYEQAKSNYVWKEISLILEAREKSLQEGMT